MLIAAPRYESRAPLGYSFGRVFLPNRLLDILALVSAECLLPVCAARRLARPSGERALVLILALALARISGGMLRCAARILAQASAERFIPLSAAPILAPVSGARGRVRWKTLIFDRVSAGRSTVPSPPAVKLVAGHRVFAQVAIQAISYPQACWTRQMRLLILILGTSIPAEWVLRMIASLCVLAPR